MPLLIEIAPEATQDQAEASDWYDSERPGLGSEFLRAANALLAQIAERPLAFPLAPSHPTVRRAPLPRRFPYRLFFEVTGERIHVVACSHVRQRPDWWADRLRGRDSSD